MATQAFKQIGTLDKHSVGNLVSAQQYIRDFANGAFFTEDIENFTLVQGVLSPDDVTATVNGAQVVIGGANQLQVKKFETETMASKIFLTAGVERVYAPLDGIEQFYNGMGERQRVVYLTHGLIFDTSAFENSVVGAEVKVGDKVKYDTTKQKFVIDNTFDPTTAPVAFEVLRTEGDIEYTLGQPTVRLVVVKGV